MILRLFIYVFILSFDAELTVPCLNFDSIQENRKPLILNALRLHRMKVSIAVMKNVDC